MKDYFAYEVLNEIRREGPTRAQQQRQQWLQHRAALRSARRGAAAGWLGARLIGLGERLRWWSLADTPAQIAPSKGARA